ncbi:hypothetical protein [Blastococcus sp. SYSU D00813]
MPVDKRGRAVASIAQPLEAEVLADGSWWPGAVLGWRHDEAGVCQAEVRVVVAGAERVRWVDLTAVRLPQGPGGAGASVPPAREPAAETVVMSRADLRELMATGLPARPVRRRRHASDLTAELPAVRCAEGVAGAGAGRHRAPAAAGRHRAADGAERAGRPAAPDPMTRPIRLDDVAGWSWGASATAVR